MIWEIVQLLLILYPIWQLYRHKKAIDFMFKEVEKVKPETVVERARWKNDAIEQITDRLNAAISVTLRTHAEMFKRMEQRIKKLEGEIDE